MANSYSQIHIHIVFAVKNRDAQIKPEWEERLFQYITGIVQNKGQKMLAINGVTDHIHFFIGQKPDCCLSDLIREVKKASNEFINEKRLTPSRFYWQEGFGAFSHSHSEIDTIINYIMNQKEHHKKRTFKEEYLDFLKTNDIEFNEKYLFEWHN